MAAPKNQTPPTAPTFEVAKVLTKTLFKFVVDSPLHIKIDGPMYVGKQQKGRGDKAKMEPATLADVTNLETGEEGQIILGAAVKSIFEENYPDNSYVGKKFRITKLEKAADKQYFPYNVVELK